MPAMLVAISTYTAPLEEVDRHREAHFAWIDPHLAAGRVLAAGRRTPPTGAVVLLAAMSPADAEAFFAQDPYVMAGVAEYEIVADFDPVRRAPGLDALAG